MRDMFDKVGAEAVRDPQRSAAQGVQLPKRFYEEATAVETGHGHELRLDGRPARTPGRSPLALAERRIAEAIAAEWAAQGERIDPATMPLTRMANSAIDGVAPRMDAVRDDILAYAGSDLLCYRAEGPAGLVERQNAAWNPVLNRLAEEGARFNLAEGVMPVEQPSPTLETVRGWLDEIDDPMRLTGLHVATTITGSAILALSVERQWIAADEAWGAAHVDEDWNREQWGHDEIAEKARAVRRRDYDAAALILARP